MSVSLPLGILNDACDARDVISKEWDLDRERIGIGIFVFELWLFSFPMEISVALLDLALLAFAFAPSFGEAAEDSDRFSFLCLASAFDEEENEGSIVLSCA